MNSEISIEATKVLNEILQKGPIRASELIKNLGVSSKTIHKHLVNLQNQRLIIKRGNVPETYYLAYPKTNTDLIPESKDDILIENNYIYVSPVGEVLRGVNGFDTWCKKNGFDFEKEKQQFIEMHKTMQKFKKGGVISAKKRILSQKYSVNLDQIYFSDFYTIGHHGKTKLGQLIYIAKTSQNRVLALEISNIIKPAIESLIEKHKIEYIGYVPPTVDRKVQIMDLLENYLHLDKKKILINKLPISTKVAQKTLRKLEDRIENAANTIIVKPTQVIEGNVLLIDDATGSGATLNEISKKIRKLANKKIKVIGYTVVGSYKGFDVISEI